MNKQTFIQIIRYERKEMRWRNKCTKHHTLKNVVYALNSLRNDERCTTRYNNISEKDFNEMVEWAKDRMFRNAILGMFKTM